MQRPCILSYIMINKIFNKLQIGDTNIAPPLFLAPMAGITNSAFRRLVADFGGYGALFTEMLSGKALIHENLEESPYTKIRPQEGSVFYQLALRGNEDFERIGNRLRESSIAGVDINLGCAAPRIKTQGIGVSLYADLDRLDYVLNCMRKNWAGPLLVKCRLGDNRETWKEEYLRRLELFERYDVCAITIHPRFADEKFKRHAKWEHFAWIADQSSIPIIANGDILCPKVLQERKDRFLPTAGIMIGRMSVVKPWIFREFSGLKTEINYCEVWQRFYNYLLEDFPKGKALGRIKQFTTYYAKNFKYGHALFSKVQSAQTVEEQYEKAVAFLEKDQELNKYPSVNVL